MFSSVIILCPLYLSLSDICVRYPLSSAYILLNRLTSSNLTLALPISFNFLLNAVWPIFIWFITSLNYLIVTTCESGSNISAILMLLPELNSPGVIVTAAFNSILSMLVLP